MLKRIRSLFFPDFRVLRMISAAVFISAGLLGSAIVNADDDLAVHAVPAPNSDLAVHAVRNEKSSRTDEIPASGGDLVVQAVPKEESSMPEGSGSVSGGDLAVQMVPKEENTMPESTGADSGGDLAVQMVPKEESTMPESNGADLAVQAVSREDSSLPENSGSTSGGDLAVQAVPKDESSTPEPVSTVSGGDLAGSSASASDIAPAANIVPSDLSPSEGKEDGRAADEADAEIPAADRLVFLDQAGSEKPSELQTAIDTILSFQRTTGYKFLAVTTNDIGPLEIREYAKLFMNYREMNVGKGGLLVLYDTSSLEVAYVCGGSMNTAVPASAFNSFFRTICSSGSFASCINTAVIDLQDEITALS